MTAPAGTAEASAVPDAGSRPVEGPELTVVLPTLNEAGNVGPLLQALRDHLAEVAFEVVLVDDGSDDGTVAEARRALPSIRVVEREDATGLGTAVVRGLREARGTHVAVMDSDGQHPPDAVPRMLDAARRTGADLVVGSRYVDEGSDDGLAGIRSLLSRGARALAGLALPSVRGHGITDPMSGLFLVRRDPLRVEDLEPTGYKILLEILVRCPVETVDEVGYRFRPRTEGESKLGTRVMAQFLIHLVRLAWAETANRRMVLFGLVGLVGVGVNLGMLVGLTEHLGIHYLLSAAVAIEVSIVHNWGWNDAFTFRDGRCDPWPVRLAKFNAVSLSALGVNLVALAALTELAGVHYVLSETIAIVLAFAVNYAGNGRWTYDLPEVVSPSFSLVATGPADDPPAGDGPGEPP